MSQDILEQKISALETQINELPNQFIECVAAQMYKFKGVPEYLSISQIAERFNISQTAARELARSKHLRRIKGAVVNISNGGTNEVLRINPEAVVKVFEVQYKGWG